jgi:hypothetical protein
MNQKMHDWIVGQIEASAAAPGRNVRAVIELADAAATLRGAKEGQIFGLQVTRASIPSPEALADRCLSVLAGWVPYLTETQAEQVARMLHERELPSAAIGLPEIAPLPTAVARLNVYLKANVVDVETGRLVTDPSLVMRFVGARASGYLDDVPCLVGATGGEHGWYCGGSASIVEDPAWYGALLCELALDLAKVPDTVDITGLLRVIEEELFFTSWGLDLAWEIEPDRAYGIEELALSVDVVPIEHRLERIARA